MRCNPQRLSVAVHRALVFAAAAAGVGAAHAQDAAPAEGAQTLDRIEVTGSRIKRADVETSQPVFSLNREEIQAQGLTSIGDVIQNLTSNGTALNTNVNNGGTGESQVSLRNLGSNRTLVLVNGRRWIGGTNLGGAVDLNSIPTAAVERIEVLKDGASAIYGSDAIAGVVNIILRERFDGAEANAFVGQYDQGDGLKQSYDFLVGASGERYSAMLGLGYVKEDAVKAGDRAISAVPVFGSTPGFRASSTTPAGTMGITPDDGETILQPDGAPGFFVPTGTGTFRPYAGLADNYNFAPDNILATPQERVSLFANGTLDITDALRFKVTTQYNKRESAQLLAPMPLVLGVPAAGTLSEDIVISAQSIYNPYGQDINWIQRRANETGGRKFVQNVDTLVVNAGFDGDFEVGERFFNWDAGYFYGENKRNDSTAGLFNVIALRQALGPSFRDAGGVARCGTATAVIAGCVPLNLLGGAGTITPEMLAATTFIAHDQLEYKQKTYYANIAGDLFELPGGPFAFAAGVEHREESGFDQPDALINSGNTTGNARTATRGGYKVDEAYLELAIPVLKDLPFARLLDFSVATRYSDYSNFGDTTNSKFGFRWKPIDDLLVRGNYSQGFRAPSISELFTGVADSFPQVADPCAGSVQGQPNTDRPACTGIPAYNQSNPQVRISVGGNPQLGPETSTSRTLGLVYSPGWLQGFNVSLDWWRIEIDDAVLTLSAQTILDQCHRNNIAAFCNLVQRSASGQITNLLALPNNAGTLLQEGYDLTVGYRLPETRWGRFGVIWDTSYTAKSYSDINGDGSFSEDPVTGDGGNTVGEYYGGGPSGGNNWRIRSNVALRWERGDFGATWNIRYFSPQTEVLCVAPAVPASQRNLLCSDPDRFTNLDGNDPGTAPDGSVRRAENAIPSVTYSDISGYMKLPWNARITLGVNNAFDRDRPRLATSFANSSDAQLDIPGRFYYMQYQQKF